MITLSGAGSQLPASTFARGSTLTAVSVRIGRQAPFTVTGVRHVVSHHPAQHRPDCIHPGTPGRTDDHHPGPVGSHHHVADAAAAATHGKDPAAVL